MKISTTIIATIIGTIIVLTTASTGAGATGSCPGICQPTSYSCAKPYVSGLCPGSSSIECCEEATPSCSGQCQVNSLPCSTGYEVGKCPGGNDIQCCPSSSGGGSGVRGVDVSALVSSSSFSCLKSSGYTYAIVRAFQSTGRADPNCVTTIKNARAAGISNVGVYMFPCPTCSATAAEQVTTAVNNLKNGGVSYNIFWLDIEGTQYWSSSTTTNRDFFNGLVAQLKAMGQTIGVYTSASQWNPIFGSSFTAGSSFPLWYAHYDNVQSFSDFTPFGGWTKPSMKQYQGDQTVCSVGVDLDWSPTAP